MCALCGSPVWPSPPVVGPLRGPPLWVNPEDPAKDLGLTPPLWLTPVGGVLPCRVPVSRGICSSSCLSLVLMSESHCTVVKMVGVQEPLLRYPLSIANSSCASRSLGEVASSSGVQQDREQKCSAGRKLGGGDDDFDY